MGNGTDRLTPKMLADYVRAHASANRQKRELFTRIQATVSLMMTTINSDHPYAAHLSRIEQMAQRGIALANATPSLPAIGKKRPTTKKASPPAPSASSTPPRADKATDWILLADGDDMFLGIGKQMLQATGYQVLTARTGEEILRTYRKKKADIALVMLGLVTPEPAGTVSIYRQLRRLDPHVAVLISNGYGIDKETRQVLTDSRNAFIERPFSIQELSQKIGTLLDRHKPSRTID